MKQAVKLDAQEKLELIQISAVPYMKKYAASAIIKAYTKIALNKEPADYARIQKDRIALKRRLKGSVL